MERLAQDHLFNFTDKIEYTRRVRQLFISAEIDLFDRFYEHEEYKPGAYCKIVKRF
ncbi:MAG: hypothetical protein KOO66_14010 [Bacteroidales bacterium]|nr:hypothetical protein [Bacteroidales bacterium]